MKNHNTFRAEGSEASGSQSTQDIDETKRPFKVAARYNNESAHKEPLDKNPAEQTVEDATDRIANTYQDRGAEIRSKIKEKLGGAGRAIGNMIRRNGDRALGFAAATPELARQYGTSAKELAADVMDAASQRMSQRQARKERKLTAKERAKSEEFNNAKADEAELLSGVQTGDADTFNYMPKGSKNERAGRQAAKQEAIDSVHAEALKHNSAYDEAYESSPSIARYVYNHYRENGTDSQDAISEQLKNAYQRQGEAAGLKAGMRAEVEKAHQEALEMEQARQAQEDAEYDDAADKAEDFLKQFKGRKDLSIVDIKRLYNDEFGNNNSKQHVQAAYNESFSIFIGKKTKSAVRAARIKQGREQVRAAAGRKYESARDTVRDSETYNKANAGRKKLGRLAARLAGATATFTRRAKAATNAARASWQDSAPKPTAESESTDNE